MKFMQEKQKLQQQIEVVDRDRILLMERIETLENVMERQQQLFESKITALKQRVKTYKNESVIDQGPVGARTKQSRNEERRGKTRFRELIV